MGSVRNSLSDIKASSFPPRGLEEIYQVLDLKLSRQSLIFAPIAVSRGL